MVNLGEPVFDYVLRESEHSSESGRTKLPPTDQLVKEHDGVSRKTFSN